MYSLSTTKKIFALAAIIASFSIAAETKEQDPIETVDAEAIVSTEPELSDVAVTEENATEIASVEEEVTEIVNVEEDYTEIANVEEEYTEIANVEEEYTEIANVEEEYSEIAKAEDEVTDISNIEEEYTELATTETSFVKEATGADIHTCPINFYEVKLPTNGKLCQVFATDLPASMIFFVPQLPEEVIAFFEQDSAIFSTTRHVKDRVLLQSEDKNTTLIISTDGSGTQVDVLVKSSNS